jgi:hypothetical protein
MLRHNPSRSTGRHQVCNLQAAEVSRVGQLLLAGEDRLTQLVVAVSQFPLTRHQLQAL